MFQEWIGHEDRRVVRQVTVGDHTARTILPLSATNVLTPMTPSHDWWYRVVRGDRPVSEAEGAITIVDLFSGSGGLSLGAGMAIEAVGKVPVSIASADLDGEALAVYRQNHHPQLVLKADASSLVDYHVYGMGAEAALAYDPEIIDTALSRYVGRVDVTLAGPPCQGHSNLNNHTRRDDPRNQLYVATAAIAIALKTRCLVIENVPGVTSDRTRVVQTAEAILTNAGYHVTHGTLRASDFGAAQTRQRHFMVATLKHHYSIDLLRKHRKVDAASLRWAIGDLVGQAGEDYMSAVTVMSEENRQRIEYLFEHDRYELPNHIRPNSHKEGHTYPSVYGRLYWEKPAPTITTGFMSPGRGRYIHPSEPRVLTPREAARIQGFPDWYDFRLSGQAPSKSQLAKWIGDAVPTQLGYIVTLAALSGL